MKHHGNVTKINGAVVEPVDIITFGSPCQDLSVAGKRAGIQDGERSNLFFEAVRIIKEMRDSTNGEYPKYAVWENVPGAFSSNKGHDFHAVLEALCSVCDDTVSIPQPCDKRKPDKLIWNGAGEIVGDNYSLTWRTLDAQYWGVPQRRKRIYLVADFTGGRAGEILFKPDSLRGDMSQGNEAGQGVTADALGGVDGGSRVVGLTNRGMVCDTAYETLRAGSHGALPLVAQKQSVDGSVGAARFKYGNSAQARSIGYEDELSPTLSGAPGGNEIPTVVARQANGIDRVIPINDKATRFNGGGAERKNDGAGNGLGIGKENDPSPTVTAADRHAVCYSADCRNGALNRELSTTLQAKPNGGFSYNCISPVVYDARRNGDGERACYTSTPIARSTRHYTQRDLCIAN